MGYSGCIRLVVSSCLTVAPIYSCVKKQRRFTSQKFLILKTLYTIFGYTDERPQFFVTTSLVSLKKFNYFRYRVIHVQCNVSVGITIISFLVKNDPFRFT